MNKFFHIEEVFSDETDEITPENRLYSNKSDPEQNYFGIEEIPKLEDNLSDNNYLISGLLKNSQQINFEQSDNNKVKELYQKINLSLTEKNDDNVQSELNSFITNNHLDIPDEKIEIISLISSLQNDEKIELTKNEARNKKNNFPKFHIIKASRYERKAIKGKKKYYIHTKYVIDNTQKRIKVQFSKFIFEFVNGVLKGNMFKPSINNIKFRKISTLINDRYLFTKKIKEVLKSKESKRHKGGVNKNLRGFMQLIKRKAIKQNVKFNKILESSVASFYCNIYLCNNYEKKIEKYHINRKKKTKIIFFQEFLEILKNRGVDVTYIERLKVDAKNLIKKK